MNPEFWRGRRVFVTGHSGFFGGWFSLWLQRLGAEVTGYSLTPPTHPSLFEAIALDEGMTSIVGDIRDAEALSASVRDSDPEFVFHLAAQPLVRHAHAAPVETFSTNVMGTVNLLEAMRACTALRAALIFTTDKVYENIETGVGFREDDRLGGKEPYGASKACAEIAVAAYRHAYLDAMAAVATVRAGNIIGGGDWAVDRLFPDAVRAFAAGDTLRIRNPDAVRPWQHALDPARGLLMLAERLCADETAPREWNFGPPDSAAVPVGALADRMVAAWGDGARWTREGDETSPYEAGLLNLDSGRAKEILGWQPLWSLERAVNASVEWYQAFFARKDMRAFSMSQIDAMEGAN